ncbi:MAG: ATP-dependent DNA ligase [Luteibaculaceae bacterium]
MKDFAALFEALDSTTKTKKRLEALEFYFSHADNQDKVHVIALLTGKRPKRPVKVSLLRQWAAELASIPQWLFEQSYHVAGDLAETISLLISNLGEERIGSAVTLTDWMLFLKALHDKEEQDKKEAIVEAWKTLDKVELFLFNKLITGGFRIGVSKQNTIKALAKVTGTEESSIAHRLMGNWDPYTTTFNELLLEEHSAADQLSKPYPFFLAYPVEGSVEALGKASEWQAEYKWDGIRGQIIVREGNLFIWSRGEELITDKFPEFELLRERISGNVVLDGEILVVKENVPQPFQLLQTRIGRKNVTQKIKNEAPVEFWCYDILELDGLDLRNLPLHKRRQILEDFMRNSDIEGVKMPQVLTNSSWELLKEQRLEAREIGAEGLMLKKLDSPYLAGRKAGHWFKWKLDPYTIDAVLIYAMRGHGRRANLYTDYTFAVWHNNGLLPFTKAYSGLTDKEIEAVDKFVKQNTLERFGPVRSVTPKLVFEIAFEGIAESTRHKSGVALRFPRINRWRTDKEIKDASTLDELKKLLNTTL